MLQDSRRQQIEEALSKHFGKPLRLKIAPGIAPTKTPAQRKLQENKQRQADAVESITQDENVRAMVKTFDAEVVTDAIYPIDEANR